MGKRMVVLVVLMVVMVAACGCAKENQKSFVLIKGGTFVNTNSNYFNETVIISDFYMGKYEVSQKEWSEVMESNPSGFKGDNLPVEMVSWYDSIVYCNKRSEKEGLSPYYNIDTEKKDADNKSEYDAIKWVITINAGANGYRLPTEEEWEYAAGGGQMSKSYTYSGSNDGEAVAWYWRNAGKEYLSGDWNWSLLENNKNKTNPVGTKTPNELGLYDMSGNVREWCFDWYEDSDIDKGLFRVWKGGGWIGDITSCELSYRGKFEASGTGSDQGFRVCRK